MENRTLHELRAWARQQFLASELELSPESITFEIQLLLAASLGLSREEFIIRGEAEISEASAAVFKEFVRRRAAQEPVAYILGEKEFYSLSFLVDQRVLIPRPETELIVDTALVECQAAVGKKTLLIDVGVGSGAIIVSVLDAVRAKNPALLADGKLYSLAIDFSSAALEVFKKNLQRFSLEEQVQIVRADCLEAVEVASFEHVICVSNPPYIALNAWVSPEVRKFEPELALFSGVDGLDAPRRIMQRVAGYKCSRLSLIMEIGYDQRSAVNSAASELGFREISFLEDLQGHTRVVVLRG